MTRSPLPVAGADLVFARFLLTHLSDSRRALETWAAALAPGGRLVLPLGPAEGQQLLTVVHKDTDGSRREEPVLPVRFTPFQGGERT